MTSTRSPRTRHLITGVAAVAALTVAVGGVGGVATLPAAHSADGPGQAASRTAETSAHAPESAAVTAAWKLADEAPGTEYFADDLVDELGYRPGLEGGIAANAEGDCSSPVPLPESFEAACRVHDLGYDLLRVAHREDAPIPDELRPALDATMAEHMRASCDDSTPSEPNAGDHLALAGCRIMAEVADVAVRGNTIRQSYGAPVEESFPW